MAFDRERLGQLNGLDVLHLQCHIGTDTLSLSRLGAATVTGLDLSGDSLQAAAELAARAGATIEYVHADVYSAPEALRGRTFDLVYTGIGALCWLPSIQRWAQTVARLLRPGGRLFVRDGHPMLGAAVAARLATPADERAAHPSLTAGGELAVTIEFPYFERSEPLEWVETTSYAGTLAVTNPRCWEWSHGLGEIVTAVLEAGMELRVLQEHDSVPWNALPGLMVADEHGEHRLADRPDRLAASFTLIAQRPA